MWANYLNAVIFQDKQWRITKHLNCDAHSPYYCLWKRRFWFFWSFDCWSANREPLDKKIERHKQYMDGTHPAVVSFDEE